MARRSRGSLAGAESGNRAGGRYGARMAANDVDGDDDDTGGEQDLLVILRLSNGQMGTNQERQAIEALADELSAAVEAGGFGEYDGEELGGGECTLFFCSDDPEQLLTFLRPLLKRSPLCRGAQVVRMVADAKGRLEPQRQNL